MLRFQIKLFLRLVITLHVSAYSATVKCVEIRGNCCATRSTAIRVFIFVMFVSELGVVSPPVPLVLPVAYPVCSVGVTKADESEKVGRLD